MTIRRVRPFAALLASALALVAAGCGGGSAGSSAGATTTTEASASSAVTLVSPQDARARIESGDVTVLDVRTPEEYAAGHIQGAMNIDLYAADFAKRVAALDHGREYVVYCRTGHRSGQATAMMAAQGFSAVDDLDGGIVAWQGAGLPVTS